MTEIRFLLDLVLSHKLPPGAKKLCLERIVEVEELLTARMINPPIMTQRVAMQAPSAQIAVAEMEHAAAQTPATAAALASRSNAIAQSMSGIPEKGRSSPRKF